MEEKKLAKILLEFADESISSAARRCRLNPSNVAGWLKNRPSSLSQTKQNDFLFYLGVAEGGGKLRQDKVHSWTIKENLDNFFELLSWVNSSEKNSLPELVRLAPLFRSPFHPSPDNIKIYAINGPFRAIINRIISPFSPVGSVHSLDQSGFPFLRNHHQLFKWKENVEPNGEYDNNPTLRIDNSIFDRWYFPKTHEEVSLEEFDMVWNSTEAPKRLNSQTDGNIVIVKDSETGLLGAVVNPTEEFCSVVFENGEWIDFIKSDISLAAVRLRTTRKMTDLVKIGEAVFAPPRIEPDGKIPADIQQKYVEAALVSLGSFKSEDGEK